jgi:hypothetical protein
MKTKTSRKLQLHRETLCNINTDDLRTVAGGTTVRNTNCGFNCSVVYTCPVTHCGP